MNCHFISSQVLRLLGGRRKGRRPAALDSEASGPGLCFTIVFKFSSAPIATAAEWQASDSGSVTVPGPSGSLAGSFQVEVARGERSPVGRGSLPSLRLRLAGWQPAHSSESLPRVGPEVQVASCASGAAPGRGPGPRRPRAGARARVWSRGRTEAPARPLHCGSEPPQACPSRARHWHWHWKKPPPSRCSS